MGCFFFGGGGVGGVGGGAFLTGPAAISKGQDARCRNLYKIKN